MTSDLDQATDGLPWPHVPTLMRGWPAVARMYGLQGVTKQQRWPRCSHGASDLQNTGKASRLEVAEKNAPRVRQPRPARGAAHVRARSLRQLVKHPIPLRYLLLGSLQQLVFRRYIGFECFYVLEEHGAVRILESPAQVCYTETYLPPLAPAWIFAPPFAPLAAHRPLLPGARHKFWRPQRRL